MQNLQRRFVLCSFSHIYYGDFSEYMNLKNLVNTLAEELVKKFRIEFIPIWLLAQLRFALLVAWPTQFDPLMMAEK